MSNIRIIKTADYAQMSRVAASVLAAQVILKPDSVLGLATGSTPVGMYELLVARCKAGELSFSQVKTVNLDEYIGLGGDHDQSYRYFMNANLFEKIDIDLKNTYLPDGKAADAQAECVRYDSLIEGMNGVDMQVLGLGSNGHIAFNEPSDSFTSKTNVAPLTQSTIDANKRFFASEQDVPKTALTMGIGQIMMAKQILLLVSGKTKAEILHKALTGPILPSVPASALQLHQNVVVVADEEALSCF